MRAAAALLLFLATSVIVGPGTMASSDDPLAPLDTSSPQATYLSFVERTSVIEQAVLAYAAERTFESQARLFRGFQKLARLFDLSEVAPAEHDETVAQSWAYLADILARIESPDPVTIPAATATDGTGVPRWTLPGTEITIVRVDSGDREESTCSPPTRWPACPVGVSWSRGSRQGSRRPARSPTGGPVRGWPLDRSSP
jgi:MscS family membrane protein